jgi:AcrR family transcriptional regulator
MVGRRERKKELMRQALLAAAIALFGDRGFLNTRIEDITDRADLAKGAFYNYFDSKEALLAELIREGIKILEEKHLCEFTPGGGLNQRVDHLVRLYNAFFDTHPEYLLLIHQARGVLKVHGGSRRLREAIAELLRRLADRLVPAAELSQWTLDEQMDLAAVLAGGVAGYRSFKLTAGFGNASPVAHQAIAAGLAEMIEQIRRSHVPEPQA